MGAIALHPTRGNHQAGYYSMSLTTRHHLICNCWTELPLPKDVIDHINTLRCCSNANQDLTFVWHDGSPNIIDLDSPNDDPYDSNYAPLDPKSTGDMDDDLSFVSNGDLTAAGVDYNDNDPNDSNNANDNNGNNDNNDNDNNNYNNDNNDNNNENNDDEHEHEHAEEEANPEEQVGEEQEEPENQNNLEQEEPEDQNDLELNQVELNNDPGTTTGVDNPDISGVDDAKIAGVEPDMDADSDGEEDLGAEMDYKYSP